LPLAWLSEKPSHLSMAQAATVGVPYIAAWSALVDAANLRAGETVLVTGASGSVGRAATQIARWKHATVIGADISGRQANDFAFIDMSREDLPARVRALTEGRGADVVLDAVGGPVFEPALKSLAPGGRQIVITSVGTRRVELDLMDFYHQRQHLIGVDTAKLDGGALAKIMDELRRGFDEGHFQTSPSRGWRLDQAADAYNAVAKGGTSERHVLLPR
jgi:NADPH:quinone reductase